MPAHQHAPGRAGKPSTPCALPALRHDPSPACAAAFDGRTNSCRINTQQHPLPAPPSLRRPPTCMAANDGHIHLAGVPPHRLRHKRVGPHHIQGGHPKQAPRVERARAAEHLGGDGHGGVDRVGDEGHPGGGAVARHALAQRAHDACVRVGVGWGGGAGGARQAGGDSGASAGMD